MAYRRALDAVWMATVAIAVACTPEPDPAPPSVEAPTHVLGDGSLNVVRPSPDGRHVALGAPPIVLDTATGEVETDAATWAIDWSEVYLLDGRASLWRPHTSVSELEDLGDAASLTQDAKLAAIVTADGDGTVIDKVSGAAVFTIDAVAAAAGVRDDLVIFPQASGAVIWTGTSRLDISGAIVALAANEAFVHVTFTTDVANETKLYLRSDGTVVPTQGTVCLVPDDDRYLQSGDPVTVSSATETTVVCAAELPASGSCDGGFANCGQSIRNADGVVLTQTQPDSFFAILTSSLGRAFVASEFRGGDVAPSTRRHIGFADGSVSTGSGIPTRHFEVVWTEGEDAVVISDAFNQRWILARQDGSTGSMVPKHFDRFFIDERVFFHADAVGASIWNLDTNSSRDLVRDPSAIVYRVSDHRLVMLDVAGALWVESPVGTEAQLLDAGPFDALHEVFGNLVVAGVSDGERLGLWWFVVEPR